MSFHPRAHWLSFLVLVLFPWLAVGVRKANESCGSLDGATVIKSYCVTHETGIPIRTSKYLTCAAVSTGPDGKDVFQFVESECADGAPCVQPVPRLIDGGYPGLKGFEKSNSMLIKCGKEWVIDYPPHVAGTAAAKNAAKALAKALARQNKQAALSQKSEKGVKGQADSRKQRLKKNDAVRKSAKPVRRPSTASTDARNQAGPSIPQWSAPHPPNVPSTFPQNQLPPDVASTSHPNPPNTDPPTWGWWNDVNDPFFSHPGYRSRGPDHPRQRRMVRRG